ncbi:MAG: ROK family protein [Pyrinomonadaceae bacterium]|nr:ROK family protein [Pyrinomonadaceae bacterium]
MTRKVGVVAAEHIAVGLVDSNEIVGSSRIYPERGTEADYLEGMPTEEIVQHIARQIEIISEGHEIEAIGIGFPGIIREGVIEESPNLQQTKGQNLERALTELLSQRGLNGFVHVLNDADAMAAGIAATHGQLDKVIRVWTLGSGIGFGRYPQVGGAGENGHSIVTLDSKERFCGCGGVGHLEGIMGHRAMRLRFLDMEPEEVFDHARTGDERCGAFVKLWHRALAAATATSIHLDGPGKFFVSGPNARFIQTGTLQLYLQEMVKMSPLQGSTIEVVSTSDEVAIIGAAVSAAHAAQAPGNGISSPPARG